MSDDLPKVNQLSIVPSKPDAEKAEEYKARMGVALSAVCLILNEAQAEGLIINYQTGKDPMTGRNIAMPVMIARFY